MIPPKIRQLAANLADKLTTEGHYKREYLRYQGLYNTILAENRCLARRDAALRGLIGSMRHEHGEKARKAVSKG